MSDFVQYTHYHTDLFRFGVPISKDEINKGRQELDQTIFIHLIPFAHILPGGSEFPIPTPSQPRA